MTATRRRWESPALIVLARSQPAEGVLTICKSDASAGDGSGVTVCNFYKATTQACAPVNCDTNAPS